jgi:hypothetical protein
LHSFYGFKLSHVKPNAIGALSVFTMLCECWLGTTPSLSLLRYYYFLVCFSQSGLVHSIDFNLWRPKILEEVVHRIVEQQVTDFHVGPASTNHRQ